MSSDYQIGYGKPPQHTRFRKGESGNRRGRPKGTQNLKADLLAELGEQVLVREGQVEKRISKQRALVKSLLAKGIRGETRASAILLGMMVRLLDVEGTASAETPLTADERAVLLALEERILRRAKAAGPAAARKEKS